MSSGDPRTLKITIEGTRQVSGLVQAPPGARGCYVLAHGAGAGMTHPFLEQVANGLAERGIATLRYQFPYMEQGSKRPDIPRVAHAAVRAAVAEAARALPGLTLFAGGKSFGGRMTSQAQAERPLDGVRGLVFLGFPLHPPGRVSDERALHLFAVQIPMLFLQGTRDEFAQLSLLQSVVERVGSRGSLKSFADADHSFRVPARNGRKDSDVMNQLLDEAAQWMNSLVLDHPGSESSAGTLSKTAPGDGTKPATSAELQRDPVDHKPSGGAPKHFGKVARSTEGGPTTGDSKLVNLYVGTSGYSYAEWKGTFYPEDMPEKQMLRFYGERFGTVEINNTFYRMPKASVLEAWTAEVPAHFKFVLKAPQRITHMQRLKDAGDNVAYLSKTAATLKEQLGPLLFQLPPYLKKDLPRLRDFLPLIADNRAAFEFRHQSWFDDDVFAVLREHRVALCIAEAENELNIPFVSTADWGYLRLRRPDYGDRELKAWVERVRQQGWREAFVFFKHEEEGKGPQMARRFLELAA